MRLFVAIGADGLSFNPQLAFKKLKVNLEQKEIPHRWVPSENYHVTLVFLGEVEADRLLLLMEELGRLAREHDPFTLKVEGLSAFPNPRSGRVIWIGVQNSIKLRSLQSDTHRALSAVGFSLEERTYTPHLTIARLRSPRKLTDIISPLVKQNFGELTVEKITLYESKSGGSFPIYQPLGQFSLGSPA